MTVRAFEIEKRDESHAVFRFHGRIERDRINFIWNAAGKALQTGRLQEILLDFQDASEVDSAGIALLRSLEKLCTSKGITLSKQNMPEEIAEFLRYTASHSKTPSG